MKVKDFLDLCTSRRFPRIVSEIDKNLDNYKTITAYFKYPCDFDKYGRCSVHRGSMCCCADCGINIGYLDKIMLIGNIKQISEIIKKYARLYDIETGFWRKNKGCALPRNMRSVICLEFICPEENKRFRSMNNKDVVTFLKLLRRYNGFLPKEKHNLHQLYIKILDKQKMERKKNETNDTRRI